MGLARDALKLMIKLNATRKEAELLLHFADGECLNATQLQARSGKSRSTVYALINRLKFKGLLLERHRDGDGNIAYAAVLGGEDDVAPEDIRAV